MALGSLQLEGIDYRETFTPISVASFIGLIYAPAFNSNLKRNRPNIQRMFSQHSPSKKIHFHLPQVCGDTCGSKTRLSNTFGGVKSEGFEQELGVQAEVVWYDRFQVDLCTFLLQDESNPSRARMMLGVHVVDIIIASLSADCGRWSGLEVSPSRGTTSGSSCTSRIAVFSESVRR